MTFSLRTLLLMFPLCLVCYGISFALVWLFWEPKLSRKDLGTEVHFMISENYNIRVADLPEIDPVKLTLWFQGQLPVNDPHYLLYQDFFHARQDSWGRPFQAVPLTADLVPQPNLSEPVWIGVYSRGADGVSSSFGLDPDDISSWRKYQGYYREDRLGQQHRRTQIEAAIVTPFLMAIGLLLKRNFYRNSGSVANDGSPSWHCWSPLKRSESNNDV